MVPGTRDLLLIPHLVLYQKGERRKQSTQLILVSLASETDDQIIGVVLLGQSGNPRARHPT